MARLDTSFFVVDANKCAGCEYWWFYCGLDTDEPCSNRMTGREVQALSHTAAEVEATIRKTFENGNKKKKKR